MAGPFTIVFAEELGGAALTWAADDHLAALLARVDLTGVSLGQLCVTCRSTGLLFSAPRRFPWPMSHRVWSSSPSSSQCLCQPASLFRGAFRLEGYPSTTASSHLPSRTAPGKAFVTLVCLGEPGLLVPC